MSASPPFMPHFRTDSSPDSHTSMLRVLGDHLHTLGVLLTRYASAKDFESACNLQRDIRTMATARDSPLGEGYMVPGARVDRNKWKPLAIDYSVWELPINGVKHDRQKLENVRASPSIEPAVIGVSSLSGANPQPVKLGFSHGQARLSTDSSYGRSKSNGRSSGNGNGVDSEQAWEISEARSGEKFALKGAMAMESNMNQVDESPPRQSKTQASRGSHARTMKTTMRNPEGLGRQSMAHPLHPLAEELQKRNAARQRHSVYHDEDEDQACFLGIFTSKTGDVLVATMILLNAFILGLQADIPWEHWEMLEIFFTVFFTGEMSLKFIFQGCTKYWRGPDWYWNWFDAFIVFFAISDMLYSQVVVRILTGSGNEFDIDGLIMVKMIRLCRLARLARLLRFKMFDELKMMIQGVVDGLRVLVWAIVLLFFFIYFIAMVMQKAVQDANDPKIVEPFSRVPWAMFTIFRCFTDGCSAHDGTPLQTHLYQKWGAKFMVPYMLIFLFVTIGLFNLIMAIFVDNVMENTKMRRRDERAAGAEAQEKELRKLLRKLFHETEQRRQAKNQPGGLERTLTFNNVREVSVVGIKKLGNALGLKLKGNQEEDEKEDGIVVDRNDFLDLFQNPKMRALIESLEINTCDHAGLFDILDADMSGELELDEVVVGLMNLRGPAEKTDMVGTLLCCRVIQQILKGFEEDVGQAHDLIYEKVMELDMRMEEMDPGTRVETEADDYP